MFNWYITRTSVYEFVLVVWFSYTIKGKRNSKKFLQSEASHVCARFKEETRICSWLELRIWRVKETGQGFSGSRKTLRGFILRPGRGLFPLWAMRLQGRLTRNSPPFPFYDQIILFLPKSIYVLENLFPRSGCVCVNHWKQWNIFIA